MSSDNKVPKRSTIPPKKPPRRSKPLANDKAKYPANVRGEPAAVIKQYSSVHAPVTANENNMKQSLLDTTVPLSLQERVGTFMSQFANLMGMIDVWESEVAKREQSDQGLANQYITCQVDVNTEGAGGYEAEMELRLQRMTKVAHMLRFMVKRERDHRFALTTVVKKSYDTCSQLVQDVVRDVLQTDAMNKDVIAASEKKLAANEADMKRFKLAYEKMVLHATVTVDEVEKELEAERSHAMACKSQSVGYQDKVNALEKELVTLEERNSNLENMVEKLNDENGKLKEEINRKDGLFAANILKEQSSEKAWKHIESLLDVAVNRLKIYEGDGSPRLLKKVTLMSSSTESQENESNMYDESPADDSVSFGSMDLSSENNVDVCELDKFVDDAHFHKRFHTLQGSHSPTVPPRRRSKKAFFSLRKAKSSDFIIDLPPSDTRSVSIDSQKTETLPCNGRRNNRPPLSSNLSLPADPSVHKIRYVMKNGHISASSRSCSNIYEDCPTNEHAGTLEQRVDHTEPSTPNANHSGVKLTPSSAISRTKYGLLSVARDLEKKLRKKRKSKTSEGSLDTYLGV